MPCHLPAGFTGSRCEEDINECGSSPCANGGLCQDQPGSFHCECLPGKWGSDTEGGGPGRAPAAPESACACACALGFAGPRCQAEVDECLSGPCPPGASCLDLPGAFSCLCPSGFTGQRVPSPFWWAEVRGVLGVRWRARRREPSFSAEPAAAHAVLLPRPRRACGTGAESGGVQGEAIGSLR